MKNNKDEKINNTSVFLGAFVTIFLLISFINYLGREFFEPVFWIANALISILSATLLQILDTKSQKKAREKSLKEKAEKAEKEALKEKLTKEYNSLRDEFFKNNGGVSDKCIVIKKFDINSEIHVYESPKIVFILGKKYKFSDIISCTFSDKQSIVHGQVTATSTTKSRTGSTLGRAVVGGVVAGGAGAIIGGTTGKKNTETIYHQEDDKVIHNYTVVVTVNSISNPIIRINTNDNGSLTNEIVALMNVIILNK